MTDMELELGTDGLGTVLVDGNDLSSVVRGVRLVAEAGRPVGIMLDVVAHARVHVLGGEAQVMVTLGRESGTGPTPADALRALADILDGQWRTPVPM